jgi:hypothetical protein
VIPKLSELPSEPERRNGVLDSAHALPGPEQQPVSKKARKVETAAATAAAWLGVLLSDHSNVTLGGSTTFDENQLVAPDAAPKQQKAKNQEPAPEPLPRDQPLVPWIPLN